MPIPALNEHGVLPAGIHDCTLAEIEERFGQFQRSDRRCRLFAGLTAFLAEAGKVEFITAVIVDGSFVTDEHSPNDIDLIVVFQQDHDATANLRPFEYNVVSKRDVRRQYRFDLLTAHEGRENFARHVDFFSRVRGRPDIRKGMLRIMT
jgi:hypothetical protein